MALSTNSNLIVMLLVNFFLLVSAQQVFRVSTGELAEYPNNPIVQALFKEVQDQSPGSAYNAVVRVPIKIVARITTLTDSRINFGSWTNAEMTRRGSVEGDEKGHLVAAMFNGPNVWYNMVPQNKAVNRNFGERGNNYSSWVDAEAKCRDWLQKRIGRWVLWTVDIHYYASGHPRPEKFTLAADMFEPNSSTPNLQKSIQFEFPNHGPEYDQ